MQQEPTMSPRPLVDPCSTRRPLPCRSPSLPHTKLRPLVPSWSSVCPPPPEPELVGTPEPRTTASHQHSSCHLEVRDREPCGHLPVA